jgi:hypothetical protein
VHTPTMTHNSLSAGKRGARSSSKGKSDLCHHCGERPCLPSRMRYKDHICCRCYNRRPKVKMRHKEKWASERYKEFDRQRGMARKNPLRAAYRAIGLEQFNIATRGNWRGKVKG